MKKILTLLTLMLPVMAVYSQDGITVCHTPATAKFAMFASNKDFNAKHPIPLPYVHVSEAGKMITFKTPDGKEASAYYLPAKSKSDNWLFVFQEWWGLNDHIKREAEKFYGDIGDVHVIALDMYDGKLATDRETAGKFMQEFKQERGNAIVKGALEYAGKKANIATVGWCFGGGQSMQATLTAGKQAKACIIYYGMPEENADKLKTLNCDVLGIFGSQDQWISPAVVQKFETNMKAAEKNVIVKMYDAVHGFANPSNAKHDKAATDDAYKASVDFLRARLK